MHLKKDIVQEQVGLHANIAAQPPRLVVWRYRVQAFLRNMATKAKALFQPQLMGDTFGRELAKSHSSTHRG
jgi:hypothetical protein